MSGSHKLLSLNESLGSLRSDTSFPFAHFVPWRHHTRSKIKVGRTNMCLDRNFPPATNTREEDYSSERQLHLFGSQRANHLDLTVDGGARIDSQSLGGFWQKLDRRGARTRKIIIKINISGCAHCRADGGIFVGSRLHLAGHPCPVFNICAL